MLLRWPSREQQQPPVSMRVEDEEVEEVEEVEEDEEVYPKRVQWRATL